MVKLKKSVHSKISKTADYKGWKNSKVTKIDKITIYGKYDKFNYGLAFGIFIIGFSKILVSNDLLNGGFLCGIALICFLIQLLFGDN